MSVSLKKYSLKETLTNNILLSLYLLIIAYISRAAILGNPFIYPDEEFYLFVGGRMLHGDIPYIDIWDRKPIGIFLIYEFFHLFGPYRIWAYQIGALLSAWLTATLCMKIARFIAPIGGAFCAGCLYLLWTVNFKGGGGQTPIFYNTLTAGAMLIITRYLNNQQSSKTTSIGCQAMILFGIAIQIKPTVIFEGMYAAIFLLWIDYKKTKSRSSFIKNTLYWCFIALIPTLCVMLFYASIHHFNDWCFANIQSIFLKESDIPKNFPFSDVIKYFYVMIAVSILFLSIMTLRIITPPTCKTTSLHLFLGGWAIIAWLAYILFKGITKHYTLPLFPPFFINAAPLWNKSYRTATPSFIPFSKYLSIGRIYIIALLITGCIIDRSGIKSIIRAGTTHDTSVIQHLLSSPPGCVFNLGGPDILLDMVPYCPLTRLPFSAHLTQRTEAKALPVDQMTEIKSVLEKKPTYIITKDNSTEYNENIYIQSYIDNYLKLFYHKIYQHSKHENGPPNIIIFMRN